MLPASPRRRRRLGLLATALTATLVAVPVAGVAPASATACLPAPLPCTTSATATTPPVVPTAARVGTTVTATPPTWDQPTAVTSYQWLRDGAAIEGATSASYLLVQADFEELISVRAYGTSPGSLAPGQADSQTFTPSKGAAITPTVPPRVSGSPIVGGTLTTTSGTWGEPTPTFTYSWFRTTPAGTAFQLIPGATTTSYRPVPADSGRTIVARVVADRVAYEPGAALSNTSVVPKAASGIRLLLPRRTVRASQVPTVRLQLASAAGIVPTGLVTILDGSRKVKTVRLPSTFRGDITVSIPKQKRGKHRLLARYAGDGTHRGADSATQVLTVTR